MRIMTCESSKEVLEKLKEEFDRNDQVKSIKIMNLKSQFLASKMKKGRVYRISILSFLMLSVK